MFNEGRALSLGGDGLERSFSGAIGEVFVDEVVCVIVNDREALYEQLQVFRCRIFEVRNVMYLGRRRFWGWSHAGNRPRTYMMTFDLSKCAD